MPNNANIDSGVLSFFIELFKYVGGIAVVASGWFLNRLVRRVDHLEKNTVSIAVFNETVGAFRKDLKDHNKNVLDETRSIRERVDKLMDRK